MKSVHFIFSLQQSESGKCVEIDVDKENENPMDEGSTFDAPSSTPKALKPVKIKSPNASNVHFLACNMCDAIFRAKSSLDDHKVKHHSVNRKYLKARKRNVVVFSDDDDEDDENDGNNGENGGRYVAVQSKRRRRARAQH